MGRVGNILEGIDVHAPDHRSVGVEHGVGESAAICEVALMADQVVAILIETHLLRPVAADKSRRRGDVVDRRHPGRVICLIVLGTERLRLNCGVVSPVGTSKVDGTNSVLATSETTRCAAGRCSDNSAAMPPLPSGTVTMMFTDIAGSTALLKDLGTEYPEALAEHRRVLRAIFERRNGIEVDTQGDAFFVVFERASDALAAAQDAQQELRGQVRVRIGVHTGEPLPTGDGYVGLDVHLAARISAAGHGGQVLVSQTTRELVGRDGLHDLGSHQLKDVGASSCTSWETVSSPSSRPSIAPISQPRRPTWWAAPPSSRSSSACSRRPALGWSR